MSRKPPPPHNPKNENDDDTDREKKEDMQLLNHPMTEEEEEVGQQQQEPLPPQRRGRGLGQHVRSRYNLYDPTDKTFLLIRLQGTQQTRHERHNALLKMHIYCTRRLAPTWWYPERFPATTGEYVLWIQISYDEEGRYQDRVRIQAYRYGLSTEIRASLPSAMHIPPTDPHAIFGADFPLSSKKEGIQRRRSKKQQQEAEEKKEDQQS